MNLSPKQESELMQVYDTWWHSYLNGDVDTYDSYLDDDYRFVGSTNGEEFLNRSDTTEFFRKTAHQLAGKARLKNVLRTVEEMNELILITDVADAYVLYDSEWAYYSRFRFTSILKETTKGWRFIYQHFSAPDSKAQEGETLGTEKIAQENLELRDAIQRRTVELELKTRELELESSLERVRTLVMSIQKSEDLAGVSEITFTELKALGFENLRNTEVIINKDEQESVLSYYYSDYGITGSIVINYKENAIVQNWVDELKTASNAFAAVEISESEMDAWRKYREEIGYVPDPKLNEAKSLFYYSYSTGLGALSISSFSPVSEEHLRILERFKNVFNLAYRRYVDVAQAEAQTREAQIELGLERVRARAMAMQRSDELADLVNTVFKELTSLDFALSWCIINIIDESTMSNIVWGANPEIGKAPESYHMKFEDYPFHHAMFKAWKKGRTEFVYIMEGQEKKTYDEYLFNETEFRRVPENVQGEMRAMSQYSTAFTFSNFGGLQTIGLETLSDPNLEILARFGKVFDLTYTRFNDLKKAEAQAREARIETALERTRTQSMLMQHSDELDNTSQVFHEQLRILGINTAFSYLWLLNEEKEEQTFWATYAETQNGTAGYRSKAVTYHLDKTDPYMAECLTAWKDGESTHLSLIPQAEVEKYLQEWHELFNGVENLTPDSFPDGLCFIDAYMKYGTFGLVSDRNLTEEEYSILRRFAIEFERTYTRFLDLKNAEALTYKARIEVALERVRARALAMQNPEELTEVAEVLRQEMGLLGMEELETCSIYIHDENSEKAECWYAVKDVRASEKQLVSDQFALNLNDTWVGREMLRFYNSEEEQTSIVMEGIARKEWIHKCEELSADFRGYYGDVIPDRTYHLHKFSNGAIGVATPDDISAENWDLLKRAASVFSLAYSRFKDLSQARLDLEQLKTEKHRAEQALTELRSTQSQLIHAEKMASLGELTAGIAHEIQNPLNFVNNFSEVSNELIDEMHEEIKAGDLDEASAIANDIKQNLEKIHHHGRRADAIVKGMLQHSRSSSSTKEPTDISKLSDEYLKLAYHGLRAKDNTFNVTLETDYDESIGKIDIIPQDIGRVILNLITNAFYIVTEKEKLNIENYTPTVAVITKKVNNSVEVRVRDNGNGIPESVVDKIFQPFFTTKPTGQGTGLGLSLSYDIVKAHGGTLDVETKTGEGTTFTIKLPLDSTE